MFAAQIVKRDHQRYREQARIVSGALWLVKFEVLSGICFFKLTRLQTAERLSRAERLLGAVVSLKRLKHSGHFL